MTYLLVLAERQWTGYSFLTTDLDHSSIPCFLSWRQKGLSVYLKQYPVRPFCLWAEGLIDSWRDDQNILYKHFYWNYCQSRNWLYLSGGNSTMKLEFNLPERQVSSSIICPSVNDCSFVIEQAIIQYFESCYTWKICTMINWYKVLCIRLLCLFGKKKKLTCLWEMVTTAAMPLKPPVWKTWSSWSQMY